MITHEGGGVKKTNGTYVVEVSEVRGGGLLAGEGLAYSHSSALTYLNSVFEARM